MKVLLLVILNCLFWIINSISFWQMGLKSGKYPFFILWFTLIPYVIILPPLLLCKKFRNEMNEKTTKDKIKIHLCYILYAFLSTLDSTLEVVAGSHIGGIIQDILSSSIPIPFVGFLVFLILKKRFGKYEILGSILVILGSILQVVKSSGIYFGSIFWVLLFSFGLLCGGLYTVVWEISFEWYDIKPIPLLAWSTIYSVIFYTIVIVIAGSVNSELWSNQYVALREFFTGGTSSIPLLIYAISSILSDFASVYLVSNDSAFFLIIADTLSTPLIAIIFSFHFIFGNDAEPLTWYSIISLLLIVLGMLIYKLETMKSISCFQKYYQYCCGYVYQEY